MEKVLFDTDIGNDIDDALALAYLLSEKRCELMGVTTTSGQGALRAEMVSAICHNAGRPEVPVHVGLPVPLYTEDLQPIAYQAAALKDWKRDSFGDTPTAIDFMHRVITENPGEINLLSVGPMTNIGALFLAHPEVPRLLKSVILMCGLFFDSPGGENNACCDPYATAAVYGNNFRERPVRHVSYGINVTRQVYLPREEARKKLSGVKVLEPVADFAEVWFRTRERITFHDPLAAVGLFDPDVCKYKSGFVKVSLHAPTMGWTVFNSDSAEKPHLAASEVDPERFFKAYFSVVA